MADRQAFGYCQNKCKIETVPKETYDSDKANIDSSFSSVNKSIQSLNTTTNDLKSSIAGINSDVTNLILNTQSMKTDINNLELAMDETYGRIGATATDTHTFSLSADDNKFDHLVTLDLPTGFTCENSACFPFIKSCDAYGIKFVINVCRMEVVGGRNVVDIWYSGESNSLNFTLELGCVVIRYA